VTANALVIIVDLLAMFL